MQTHLAPSGPRCLKNLRSDRLPALILQGVPLAIWLDLPSQCIGRDGVPVCLQGTPHSSRYLSMRTPHEEAEDQTIAKHYAASIVLDAK
ncbi:uncharacterized protein STAUR_7189 [Stigmatella aurantiaca DW4/3-1]|uniref:Uncharacterized protein n=1 Tax=Stigmatella aurantiaca (strain DW4/3-1) TaxID=378806 RepID=E3FZC8_STIAD|nr:uncharacterized protein STAUR_7189 [Stigmatella aurantiaca DW4/3-1]